MSPRRQFLALLVVFAVAAILRLGLLARSGLWPDEVFSLAIATGHSLEHPAAAARPELGDFVEPDHPVLAEEFRRYLKHENPPASPSRVVRAVLLSDTSPPLYYLLLYGWTLLFGTSDVVLRLFSTVCSLSCLPFLASIARRTGGKGAVIPAWVLFAFSPLAIYYSTEGRMYSLLLLCVLALSWASLILRQREGSGATYFIWIAASVAGFLTHYFFLYPFLAVVTYLLLRPGKLTRTRLVICLLLTFALIFPWYLKIRESLGNWRITQGWLKLRPGHFNRVTASFDLITQFFSGRAHELWAGHILWNMAALLLFFFVACTMLWRLRTRIFRGRRLLLWLLFAAACAGPLTSDFGQLTFMVAYPRYAIAALPAAYLLGAAGLACLGRRARIIILALIVLAWAPNVVSIYRNRVLWEPMREIARAASVNSSPSDLILVHSIPSGLLGIARYAEGSAPLGSWVGQLGTHQVPGSLHILAAGHARIVFVRVHDVGAPAPEEDWLRANALLFHQRRLGLGLLADFRPKGADTF